MKNVAVANQLLMRSLADHAILSTVFFSLRYQCHLTCGQLVDEQACVFFLVDSSETILFKAKIPRLRHRLIPIIDSITLTIRSSMAQRCKPGVCFS